MPVLAREGIAFNSVAPGGIYIERMGFEDEKKKDGVSSWRMIDRYYPLGRLGTPDEAAALVVFL